MTAGAESEATWTPPFCAHEAAENIECPKCGAESVRVREQSTYLDADEVEAYCGECHAALRVYANVTIEFSDVEVTDAE